MLNKRRVTKKKKLTDPVQIIPFQGQKLRERQQAPSQKSKTQKETKKIFAPRKVNEPTGKLNQKTDPNTIDSIKKDLDKQKASSGENELDLDNMPADSYTPEKFEIVWKEIIQYLKDNNDQTLYTAFLTHKPKLMKPFRIHVYLENQIQGDDLDQKKTDILGLIRKKLNNWKVELTASLIDEEEVEEKGKQYDNKEKFKKWVEKNPGLLELKKKFNLDIDL